MLIYPKCADGIADYNNFIIFALHIICNRDRYEDNFFDSLGDNTAQSANNPYCNYARCCGAGGVGIFCVDTDNSAAYRRNWLGGCDVSCA